MINQTNKRILITGAAGFVGQHLVHYLQDQGYQIVALVRENTDTLALKGVEIFRGDLRQKDSLYPAFAQPFDAIVHLATTMKGPWEEYKESTVQGTRRLLEIARDRKVNRFIYMSSIAVHEASPNSQAVITEYSPLVKQGLSHYERSKIEAEGIVQEFMKEGVACTILRSGVIYGPGGALYPPRLGLGLGEKRYLVIGNGENRIPLTFVENLNYAVKLAIEKDEAVGGIFNIVDDQVITQQEFLQAVKKEVNPSLKVIRIPYAVMIGIGKLLGIFWGILKRPSPIRKSYLSLCAHQLDYSNEKVKEVLGWSSIHKPPEALKKTCQWFKQRQIHPKDVDIRILKTSVRLADPVNVGIVGCGVIARSHLEILKKIGNLKVVGLCDSQAEAAERLSREFGGTAVYKNLGQMMAKERLDAVHILTPPQGRLELVRSAARQRCAIFLEKPMALNAEEAREMIKAAQKSGAVICLGHNHLFDPPMIEARRLITRGAVGDVLCVESWYGFNLSSNLNSRYMLPGVERHWSMQLPGKLYQNLISHPISVLTDCLGRPNEIFATAVSGQVVKSMKTDELKVMMKAGGKVGLLTVSLAVNPRYQFLNIYGSRMSIFVDFLNKTLIKHSTPKGLPKAMSRALMSINAGEVLIGATFRNFFKVLTGRFTYLDGTENLIKEFYRRLKTDQPMPVTAEDGLLSMEIMDEIWKQVEV